MDFSGAEIAAVTNRAAILALKRYVSGKVKECQRDQDYTTRSN